MVANSIILFYKYAQLDQAAVAESQRKLCESLSLTGRVLVAPEGINGTLSGTKESIDAYVAEMRKHEEFADVDFKDSEWDADPFPDLVIKPVAEVISTGNTIPFEMLAKTGKHLKPEEFHNMLVEKDENTVVIDCRNAMEVAVGHFEGAVDPRMKTFVQWQNFVDKKAEELKDKRVMMYCTGGIRCEKASAYLRDKGVDEVYQLKGGIHRYLQAYPDGGQFRGKNFVFDQRVAMSADHAKPEDVVGSCLGCNKPWDTYTGLTVCTVCRDNVLYCTDCLAARTELHCQDHKHLEDIYFTFLDGFTVEQLQRQAEQLEAGWKKLVAEAGTAGKNKRKTLHKQLEKVRARIADLEAGHASVGERVRYCRSCGRRCPQECEGTCWGFWLHPSKTTAEASGTVAGSGIPGVTASTGTNVSHSDEHFASRGRHRLNADYEGRIAEPVGNRKRVAVAAE